MRILVVEDDAIAKLVLLRVLKTLGHEAVVASNGQEALDALETERIDVIISDWMMTPIDGIELCQRVRADSRGTYRYFIMLTAKSLREDRHTAIQAGADDLLQKPLDTQELAARLLVASRILEMQRKLQQKGQELAQMTDTVQLQRQRSTDLFKGLPIPCVTVDDLGHIMEWNRSAESLFQQKAFEVWGQPLAEKMTAPRQRQYVQRLVDRSLSGELVEGFDWKYPLHDSRRLHLVVSAFPIFGPSDEQVGSVFAFVDVTKQEELALKVRDQLRLQKELSAKLELLATTDGLTGLHNNRTFKAKLDEEIAISKRTGRPLSLVLADVDKFKSVNDDFGHLVGDEVLRKVATVFKSIVRRFDDVFAARYGGEEFVLLTPGHGPDEATEIAEATRIAIMNEHWTQRNVTASFGVSTWNVAHTVPEAFIEQADQALYYCKLSGRNCSHHFDEIPPEALEAA